MYINQNNRDNIKEVTLKLLGYCRANDWAGYDPYDALNSKIYNSLPFLNNKPFRLALIQGFKRSPVNLRPLFLVPKTQNPKALALFLMAFINLKKMGLLEDETLIPLMVQRLIALRSGSQLSTANRNPPTVNREPETGNYEPVTGNPYYCWGYSFPWQTRTLLVPRGAPNIVGTAFVANALLDLYESELGQEVTDKRQPQTGNGEPSTMNRSLTTGNDLPDLAVSAAEYMANELFWERGPAVAGFSYPLPGIKTPVHNANFLGAALLCRVDSLTGGKRFQDVALKVARYSASRQGEDGSWDYGEGGTQAWVDNFHTGYNLCALRDINEYGGTEEFEPVVRKGFDYYRKYFIREDGAPKYYWNSVYPLDIHSVAQSIITLLRFKDLNVHYLESAFSVYRWAVGRLWNNQDHFFYQKHKFYRNKISYMRWSQAWMLLALSLLLIEVKN
ncbi:MAG: hypothetical protein AB1585_22155 [Thermodesulfobacteriota bacterium]